MELGSLIAIGLGVAISFILVFLMVNLYVKCGPNEAMIISGMYAGAAGNSFKIIVGGGAVMLPMIQQLSRLSLAIRTVRVKSKSPIVTADGVPIQIDVLAGVRIKGDQVSIATAAEQLLGKTGDEVESILTGIILSAVRVEVSSMNLAQVRKGVNLTSPHLVEELVTPLSKMGMACESLSIDVLDDAVVISNSRSSEEIKPGGSGSVQNDLQQSISTQLVVDQSSRLTLITEYERAMPILEKELGEQNVVFKEFLLRYATILAIADDYLSREKAEQIRDRAKKIQLAGLSNLIS
jgi:flotillin